MAGTYKVNGDKLTGLTVYSTTPIGTIVSWLSDDLPVGFLKCDGAEYNKADYPDLWEKLKDIPECQSEHAGKFYTPLITIERKLSDLETFTISTDSTNPTECQYDGFAIITSNANSELTVNGTTIGRTRGYDGKYNTTTIPVKKGDLLYINTCYESFAMWYESPGCQWIIKAVDYVSLPQNAIDDTRTTTGNAWSADKIAEYVQNYNKLSDYEEVQQSDFGNSEATAYTAEYDGFLYCSADNTGSTRYFYATIKNAKGNEIHFNICTNGGAGTSNIIPIEKGDKIWYRERSNGISYYFRYYKNR